MNIFSSPFPPPNQLQPVLPEPGLLRSLLRTNVASSISLLEGCGCVVFQEVRSGAQRHRGMHQITQPSSGPSGEFWQEQAPLPFIRRRKSQFLDAEVLDGLSTGGAGGGWKSRMVETCSQVEAQCHSCCLQMMPKGS